MGPELTASWQPRHGGRMWAGARVPARFLSAPLNQSLMRIRLSLPVRQPECVTETVDTHLACQLGKQPPEPVVNVILAGVYLEGGARGWEQVRARKGPPRLPRLPQA